jgi:hypothetical protein
VLDRNARKEPVMKKKVNPLKLHKETVQLLEKPDLQKAAAGGITNNITQCYSPASTPCCATQ